MNRLVKCTLLITLCYVSRAGSVRADDLRKHLAEIDMQTGRTHTKELEKQCLDLLDEYTSPEDRGRIYAEIAHLHVQTGLKDPDKTAEYCEKALEYPLGVVTAARTYGYWASALHSARRRQVRWSESPWNEFPDGRREIAARALRGMKLILDEGVPAEKQPLPPVDKFTCHPPDSPSCQELVRKNKEQARARRKAMFENTLVRRRDVLTDKCAYIYSQEPVDTGELAAIASEILADEDAVADLLSRVEARIMERSGAGRTNKE